jgi:beta-lactamase class A
MRHRPAIRRRAADGLLVVALGLAHACALAADWRDALAARIERLDRDTPGELGVFVQRLDSGERYAHEADRAWYLSSAAKVPIAIAVLQDVDAGRLRLADTIRLEAHDRIDGVGELTWARVGTTVTIDSLLDRMLGPSDSTAANMLIRAVGIERVNRSAQAAFGGRGLGRLTDFTEVRRDVYGELHPDARRLANEQMVRLAGIHPDARRVDALRAMLGIEAGALRARTLADAHDRYYRRGLNSATLEAYGGMLARLVRGELLSPASTARLFAAMKLGRRGTSHRLEAGVPASRRMIHKTGTQYRRACHMAVLDPEQGGRTATIVATCVADLDQGGPADAALAQVGRALAQALGPPPRR